MSEAPILTAAGLAVGYRSGRGAVLEGLDLELRAGELVFVLGPNGAGKSTLLRTLAGLQPALAGRVVLDGLDLARLEPRRRARRVGVVLPERAAAGLLTAREVVSLGRYPHTGWSGRLGAADRAVVEDALGRVGVLALAGRPLETLSDGERQKVMIARALAQEPALLVLDEPTAFLDLPGRLEVMELLGALARGAAGARRAVLVSTHELDLALRTADRLWLLGKDGVLVQGTPRRLVAARALERVFPGAEVRRHLAPLLDALASL